MYEFLQRDKNNYCAKTCSEIESHANKNQVKDLFVKIEEITRQFHASHSVVKNESEGNVTESDKILETWRSFCIKTLENKSTARQHPDNQTIGT